MSDGRASPDVELVLQDTRFLAQHEVDPSPELAIDDLPVAGKVRLPRGRIVTEKIVHLAGRPIESFHRGVAIGPDESEREGETAIAVAVEGEHHLGPGGVEAEPVPAREVKHAPVHLTRVPFESNR
jgi:hypothetical protein